MIFIDEIDSSNCSVSPLTDRTPEMDLSYNPLSGHHVTQLGYDLSECDPFACTFTFNTNTVFKKLTEISYYKNGNPKKVLKEILLINVSPEQQWNYMVSQILGWRIKLSSKYKITFRQFEIYPEFTKNGLIHAHGLLYSDSKGYASGYSLMMASVWSSMNKLDLRATWSINYQGKKDYAFAVCNNVEKWTEYIRKEFFDENDIKQLKEFSSKYVINLNRCGHGQQPNQVDDIR